MKSNLVLFFILSFIVCSCGNKKANNRTEENNIEEDSIFYIEHQPKKIKREFPKVKKLSEYPKTEFLPTLENKISKDKNAVYCVTLLYAWDELRNTLNTTFVVPNELQNEQKDLVLINNSTSFKNSLNVGEYKVEGKIEDDAVTVRAEFNKSLPFEADLHSFDNELIFQEQKIASFGVFGEDKEYIIRILYYKNDDEFILRLNPKEEQYEIILFKTQENFKTLAQMNERLKENILKGNKEGYDSKLNWKFHLSDEDEVVIPKLNFNIENNFEEIEGNQINAVSTNRKHSILRVWQRTAFMLDEKGAEIENELEMMADSVAIIGEEIKKDKPKPKKMRFDKPFFVVLKKTQSLNPYFVLFANNSELMVKE
jgi:hypothetical protein